jgi:hypothetical protein
MGARNTEGIGLSYLPARLHRLAESIRGLLKSFKIPALESRPFENLGRSVTDAYTVILVQLIHRATYIPCKKTA